MSQHTTYINVESRFGVTLHIPFIYHEPPSSRLMILLPGRGYTSKHPLLYYMRKVGLQHGFDVLSLQYGFQAANTELTIENTPYLMTDVMDAVDVILTRRYQRLCVVGKSLGTPLAAQLARDVDADDVSLILLTPLGGALQGLGNIRTLAIIGTADPLYAPEVVAAFDGMSTIRWRVFDDLNHSLEVDGDWQASMNVLHHVIESCEHFLLEGIR